MNTPIAAPMTGSTHVHPVRPHTIAATMTPIDPSVSDNTSSDAPCTLRLSVAPGRSSISATTFTISPMMPTISTGNDAISRSSPSRTTAS